MTAGTTGTVYRSLRCRRSLSSCRKRCGCVKWSKVRLQGCCLSISNGNPPPKFEQDGATFIVTLRKRIAPSVQAGEVINEGITEVIKEAIKSNPGIKKPILVKAVGKSRATVERALADLGAAHVTEHHGSKKTGGYYLVTEGLREAGEGEGTERGMRE